VGKKKKDEEEKPGPNYSKKEHPAPKQGPSLVQQLYNLKNSTQEDKKKNIQTLIYVAKSKQGKKCPFQEKQGQGKGGGNGPKHHCRGGKTDVPFAEEDKDDDDCLMTGTEASSIFGWPITSDP